jgi:hypothetical protein
MKIGSRDGAPAPAIAASREEFRRQQRLLARDHRGTRIGIEGDAQARCSVRRLELLERQRELAAILEGLAQREAARLAVFGRDIGAPRQRLHRGEIVVVESERLQVRDVPPGTPARGAACDRLSIGLDARRTLAHRAPRVAEVEPRLEAPRVLLCELLADREGTFVLADGLEHIGLDLAEEGVAWVRRAAGCAGRPGPPRPSRRAPACPRG